MSQMGRYCKAYPIANFREYSAWRETAPEGEALTENSILYLQDNLVVTAGVFLDEDVVFDDVTPEWQEFCRAELRFEVPAEIARDE